MGKGRFLAAACDCIAPRLLEAVAFCAATRTCVRRHRKQTWDEANALHAVENVELGVAWHILAVRVQGIPSSTFEVAPRSKHPLFENAPGVKSAPRL